VDDRAAPADRRDGGRADVPAVDRPDAAGGVAQPRDEVEERGLARAARADDGDPRARGHLERDAVERGAAVRVDVGDGVEADGAAAGREGAGARRVGDVGRAVAQREEALGGRRRDADAVAEVAELAERVEGAEERGVEREERRRSMATMREGPRRASPRRRGRHRLETGLVSASVRVMRRSVVERAARRSGDLGRLAAEQTVRGRRAPPRRRTSCRCGPRDAARPAPDLAGSSAVVRTPPGTRGVNR
jgi:hypothetical protein